LLGIFTFENSHWCFSAVKLVVNALNEQTHVLAVYIYQKACIYLRILIENLFYRSYKKEHSYINSNQETSWRTNEQMASWCSWPRRKKDYQSRESIRKKNSGLLAI